MNPVYSATDTEYLAEHLQDHQHGSGRWRKRRLRILQLASMPDLLAARSLIFAFSMTAGSAIYFLLLAEPSDRLFWFGFSVLLVMMISLILRAGPGLASVAILAVGLLTGFGSAKIRTVRIESHMLTESHGPVMVEGWVMAIEPANRGVRIRLDIHAIAGMVDGSRPQSIRLTHTARLEVSPGRFVRCWAVMRPPPGASLPGDYDFQRQAWFEGLDAVGYVQGRCRGGVLGEPESLVRRARLRLARLQRRLAIYVRAAAGERAGGLAAALITGDRSFMRKDDTEALRGSGLAHLLAISGLHMGIIGGLAFMLVRRGLALIEPLALRVPVQKPAALAALLTCVAYLILSGASVSTQRAFIMAAVVFGAILFDRPGISLRSYAYAMVLIVTLQPESVLSPGFQMSFAATGALIVVYERWTKTRKDIPKSWLSRPAIVVKSLLVTSFVAAMATAPFALYHFHRIAGLGLIANIFAMPVVTFASAPAAAISMILAPFGFAHIGLRLFGLSLEIVLAVAHVFESKEQSLAIVKAPMPGLSLMFFSLSLACLIMMTGRLRLVCTSVAVSLAGLIWIGAPRADVYWEPSGDVIVRNADNQLLRIQFVEGQGLGSLSLRDVVTYDDCSMGICVVSSMHGKLLLVKEELSADTCKNSSQMGIRLILTVRPVTPELQALCGPILSYETLKSRGGVHIHLVQGTIKLNQVPICGTRPWRPCTRQLQLNYSGE